MINSKSIFLVFVFAILMVSDGIAQFEISSYSIDGGGGRSIGGDFVLEGTIGQPESGIDSIGGEFELTTGFQLPFPESVLLGDVNLDGFVNLLDIEPFIALISNATLQAEADCNEDGVVNLLDVEPFITILSGG